MYEFDSRKKVIMIMALNHTVAYYTRNHSIYQNTKS